MQRASTEFSRPLAKRKPPTLNKRPTPCAEEEISSCEETNKGDSNNAESVDNEDESRQVIRGVDWNVFEIVESTCEFAKEIWQKVKVMKAKNVQIPEKDPSL